MSIELSLITYLGRDYTSQFANYRGSKDECNSKHFIVYPF